MYCLPSQLPNDTCIPRRGHASILQCPIIRSPIYRTHFIFTYPYSGIFPIITSPIYRTGSIITLWAKIGPLNRKARRPSGRLGILAVYQILSKQNLENIAQCQMGNPDDCQLKRDKMNICTIFVNHWFSSVGPNQYYLIIFVKLKVFELLDNRLTCLCR